MQRVKDGDEANQLVPEILPQPATAPAPVPPPAAPSQASTSTPLPCPDLKARGIKRDASDASFVPSPKKR